MAPAVTTWQAPLSGELQLSDAAPNHSRRCKVVCTLGPRCQDEASIGRLLDAGADACHLDFCHERREVHAEALRCARAAATTRGRHVPVILELQGPGMRTGLLKDHTAVELKAGDCLKLVTDMSVEGDESCFAVSSGQLPSVVQPGDCVLLADALVALEVLASGGPIVAARVLNDGRLGEWKSCVVPRLQEKAHCTPEEVFRDLAGFVVHHDVDFVAVTAVRAADVRAARELLGERGCHVGVLARVACEAGLRHFDELLRESDGVVIARAALATGLPPEKLAPVQKAMVASCNAAGKPVVVAGQVLASMVSGPRPTRCEAADVANAALDGADALLLGDVTALGDYAETAVTTLCRSLAEAEAVVDHGALRQRPSDGPRALREACTCQAKLLVVLAPDGGLARQLARLRPHAPIVAVVAGTAAARQLQLCRCVALVVDEEAEAVEAAVEAAEREGLVRNGDPVTVVHEVSDSDSEEPEYEVFSLVTGGGKAAAVFKEEMPADGGSMQDRMLAEGGVSSLAGLAGLAGATPEPQVRPTCKVACTVGPKCSSTEELTQLIDAGVDVFCLSLASSDWASNSACLRRIREAAALRPQRLIATLVETRGPEIRVGLLRNGASVDLKAGDTLKLVTDLSFKGDRACVAVSYPQLPRAVRPGMTIFCGDEVQLQVVSCGASCVMTKIMNNCRLSERQTVRLPGVVTELPVLQLKDKDDLAILAAPEAVDFVAVSCVQSAADVRLAREALGMKGQGIRIVAKIETEAGLRNVDEVLRESDAVMLVRDTLGMSILPEKVVLAQKALISKCKAVGRPLVLDSQLLSSTPFKPSIAEALDLANAVLDGVDCVRVSGKVSFAEAAVRSTRRLLQHAEASADRSAPSSSDAAARAVEAVTRSHAALLAVECRTTEPAVQVARLRPPVPMLAVVGDEAAARHLALLWGVLPLCVRTMPTPLGMEVALLVAVREAVRRRVIDECDTVVILRGETVHVREPELPEEEEFLSGEACLQGARKLARWSPIRRRAKSFLRGASEVTANALGRLQGGPVAAPTEFGLRFLCENAERSGVVSLASGLQYKVVREGTGAMHPDVDATCVCHYEGRRAEEWPDGATFCSTYASGEPAKFALSQLIEGLGEALQCMVEDSCWEVCVPPALGYGDCGSAPDVLGGDVLVFIVELLKVEGSMRPAGQRAPPPQESWFAHAPQETALSTPKRLMRLSPFWRPPDSTEKEKQRHRPDTVLAGAWVEPVKLAFS